MTLNSCLIQHSGPEKSALLIYFGHCSVSNCRWCFLPRSLVEKGSYLTGTPHVLPRGVGGKTGAICPRHLTPVSILSPPPADKSRDKLINTRHQCRHAHQLRIAIKTNHKITDQDGIQGEIISNLYFKRQTTNGSFYLIESPFLLIPSCRCL